MRSGYCFALCIITAVSADTFPASCPNITTKAMWGARKPVQVSYGHTPTEYVIIHHTVSSPCENRADCVTLVKNIQDYHMDDLEYFDIGYNFLIGGDGNIYEGTGWRTTAAHTYGYNTRSLGIAFAGNFQSDDPNNVLLESGKKLIKCGTDAGILAAGYKLIGARQVSSTDSPGLKLYRAIQEWPHYTATITNTSITTPSPVSSTVQPASCRKIITKAMWGARKPVQVSFAHSPTEYVIVHHTATPSCETKTDCVAQIKNIQDFHMDELEYFDIGYNFLIGGDGNIYEGTGWRTTGAHTYGYNTRSLGIAFIGNYQSDDPNNVLIDAGKEVIQCGVDLGILATNYKLVGARQISGTKSPGVKLYRAIKEWPHYTAQP